MKPMYHVSRIDLGNQPILTAKTPSGVLPSRECRKPRVCFAPSVERCLLSLAAFRSASMADAIEELLPGSWREEIPNPTVYATWKRLTLPPQSRSDFALTGERWSLTDIRVLRVGYINLGALLRGRCKTASGSLSTVRVTKLSKEEWKVWQASRIARRVELRSTAV